MKAAAMPYQLPLSQKLMKGAVPNVAVGQVVREQEKLLEQERSGDQERSQQTSACEIVL